MSEYIAGSLVANPPPVAPADAAMPPGRVDFEDFKKALGPILDLVGTDDMSIFTDGFSVTSDAITFVTVVPVPGVEPIAVGDDPNTSEWGWPVTVKVDQP